MLVGYKTCNTTPKYAYIKEQVKHCFLKHA